VEADKIPPWIRCGRSGDYSGQRIATTTGLARRSVCYPDESTPR
jgi:hypothetical protein